MNSMTKKSGQVETDMSVLDTESSLLSSECMKKPVVSKKGTAVFLFTLMVCTVVLAVCVPIRSLLASRMADVTLSLETSRGRERKQQAEYNAVFEELPILRAELEELQPAADEASETVSQLKARRKALRTEIAQLQTMLEDAQRDQEASAESKEESEHESIP